MSYRRSPLFPGGAQRNTEEQQSFRNRHGHTQARKSNQEDTGSVQENRLAQEPPECPQHLQPPFSNTLRPFRDPKAPHSGAYKAIQGPTGPHSGATRAPPPTVWLEIVILLICCSVPFPRSLDFESVRFVQRTLLSWLRSYLSYDNRAPTKPSISAHAAFVSPEKGVN